MKTLNFQKGLSRFKMLFFTFAGKDNILELLNFLKQSLKR